RGPLRQSLLVHLGAGDALGVAVQHRGPVAQRPQDALADGDVVLRQVELGLATGREVHPVRAGDAHLALAHGQVDVLAVVAAGHGARLWGGTSGSSQVWRQTGTLPRGEPGADACRLIAVPPHGSHRLDRVTRRVGERHRVTVTGMRWGRAVDDARV